MNQCKQCGKEIPKGKKFCNSSCAAKYNNAHRVRKPWTEEQKKAFSRKQIIANGHDPDLQKKCEWCGEIIPNEKARLGARFCNNGCAAKWSGQHRRRQYKNREYEKQ